MKSPAESTVSASNLTSRGWIPWHLFASKSSSKGLTSSRIKESSSTNTRIEESAKNAPRFRPNETPLSPSKSINTSRVLTRLGLPCDRLNKIFLLSCPDSILPATKIISYLVENDLVDSNKPGRFSFGNLSKATIMLVDSGLLSFSVIAATCKISHPPRHLLRHC